MSAVSTAEAVPVSAPAVRFAALRGRVALPWVTVAVLAVLLAAADGAIMITMRGAVGAIERSRGPFHSWLQDSALMAPLFALAVIWALSRAYRKHGPSALRAPRRVVTAALLIAAATAAVGIVALTISTGYDYHLQSALLAKTAGLHNHSAGAGGAANSAYADSGWSPEQRDTMLLDVKSVTFGSGLMLIVNVVLVGWVVALRGGRLAGTRRARRT